MRHDKQLRPQELIQQLNLLCSEMLQLEASGMVDSAGVHPDHRTSATNLIHYLALRRHDIRQLQAQLASLGLSSLGRTEPHVIGGLDAVMKATQSTRWLRRGIPRSSRRRARNRRRRRPARKEF